MRINVAVPEAHVSRPVLDAALEATTRLNEMLIKEGSVPTFRQAAHRVRWKPEPPGDEHFDHAGVVLGRSWGDCDDLAPWHAASLRSTGEDRGAQAIVKKSGPKRWHAVVQRSDGSIDDPSKEAGMGRSNGIMGAGLPLMMLPQRTEVGSYLRRPQLALRPVRDRAGQIEAWQARADLPWHWLPGASPTDVAMASLHASPTSSQAVVGACAGLVDLGEANDVDDDVLDRAAAIADACDGADWFELADEYGEEHATAAGQVVGSFFGGLAKIAKTAINPFNAAAKAARIIPGVGPALSRGMGSFMPTTENILKYGPQAARMMPGVGPVAAQAFQMATPMLQRHLLEQRHLPPPNYRPPMPQACPPGCIPYPFG
jgi:hypothetical protein